MSARITVDEVHSGDYLLFPLEFCGCCWCPLWTNDIRPYCNFCRIAGIAYTDLQEGAQ